MSAVRPCTVPRVYRHHFGDVASAQKAITRMRLSCSVVACFLHIIPHVTCAILHGYGWAPCFIVDSRGSKQWQRDLPPTTTLSKTAFHLVVMCGVVDVMFASMSSGITHAFEHCVNEGTQTQGKFSSAAPELAPRRDPAADGRQRI